MMAVMEIDVDERQRVSLGKVIDKDTRRMRVELLPGGELLLTPVVSLSARELDVLTHPERVASIRAGLAEAEAGRIVRHRPDHWARLEAELVDVED